MCVPNLARVYIGWMLPPITCKVEEFGILRSELQMGNLVRTPSSFFELVGIREKEIPALGSKAAIKRLVKAWGLCKIGDRRKCG